MQIVLPSNLLRLLDRGYIEVHNNRILSATYQHTFERVVGACVDFLVRHIRRHVDEIAWPGFGGEFEMIAPTHASFAFDDVDHAFEFSVMMGAGLGVWMDAHGSRPEL